MKVRCFHDTHSYHHLYSESCEGVGCVPGLHNIYIHMYMYIYKSSNSSR